VISDNAPPGPRQAEPRSPQQPPVAEPRRRTREERMQARPTGATRSITAGRTDPAPTANPPANADASSAYGPDDPGYGPPPPGWSHEDRPAREAAAAPHMAESTAAEHLTAEPASVRLAEPRQTEPGQTEPRQTEAAQAGSGQLAPEHAGPERTEPAQAAPEQPSTSAPAAADKPAVRGPFEPLVEHGQTSAAASSAADRLATDADGRPYDFPGLDDDEPAGSADAALDRLKELHRTAAAVAPQSLDAHFDQLLERQRRLISEYITEAEGPSAATEAPADDNLVGFGGDFLGTTR